MVVKLNSEHLPIFNENKRLRLVENLSNKSLCPPEHVCCISVLGILIDLNSSTVVHYILKENTGMEIFLKFYQSIF